MSNVRLRRLAADFERMQSYVRRHPRVKLVQVEGSPPEKYQLQYVVRSLRQVGGEVKTVDTHIVEIVLPRNYPRTPPQCRMLSPVFHPNVAPHAICVGDHWGAGEPLESIVVRIGEMLAYQTYNVKSPLNGDAARWVEQNLDRVPTDKVSMLAEEDGTSPQGAPPAMNGGYGAAPPLPPNIGGYGAAPPPNVGGYDVGPIPYGVVPGATPQTYHPAANNLPPYAPPQQPYQPQPYAQQPTFGAPPPPSPPPFGPPPQPYAPAPQPYAPQQHFAPPPSLPAHCPTPQPHTAPPAAPRPAAPQPAAAAPAAGDRIKVSCPGCSKTYIVPAANRGRTAKCQNCGNQFTL